MEVYISIVCVCVCLEVYDTEARGKLWVFYSIALHFIIEAGSKLATRKACEILSSVLPMVLVL